VTAVKFPDTSRLVWQLLLVKTDNRILQTVKMDIRNLLLYFLRKWLNKLLSCLEVVKIERWQS